MTKEEFKRRWEHDENGDGLTYADIASCAKEWGLYSRPCLYNIERVKIAVLKYAGVKGRGDETK